jgi:hypothetical protein
VPSTPDGELDLAAKTVGKSKKSWFKKSRKSNNKITKGVEESPNAALLTAAAVGTGAAILVILGSEEEQGMYETCQVDTEVANKQAADSLAPLGTEDGIESPVFEQEYTEIEFGVNRYNDKMSLSQSKKGIAMKPTRGKSWFRKGSKSGFSDLIPSEDLNEPTKLQSSEDLVPCNSDKETEASLDSPQPAFEEEVVLESCNVEAPSGDETQKSKRWGFNKSFRTKKQQKSQTTTSDGDNVSGNARLVVGASGVSAAVVGVGLANQMIFESETSFEVFQDNEDKINPVFVEAEDVEAPCFCHVNDMMETDVTDVAEGANCIKGNMSVGSDGVNEDESTKISNYFFDNIGVVNELEECNVNDEHSDSSECNCEDCECSNEEAECEGIELELKHNHQKYGADELTARRKYRTLRNVSGLAGKLSRSKSKRTQ